MTRPILRFAAIGLALALASLPALVHAKPAPAPKKSAKVLVVGIDAGEWDVLGPLIDQGRCPNFARMRAQGSAGKLRSLLPLTRSPVIWTSIATGKVPQKHGVEDFFMRMKGLDTESGDEVPSDRRRPQTSNTWKARPVWDILGSVGHSVGVVGWWTTWPAQPVNGVLVTDYAQYAPRGWSATDTRVAYPESLLTLVTRLRRSPESVSWAELFQFVPAFDTTSVTPRQGELVRDIRWIYAADVTFYRVAMELYRREEVQVHRYACAERDQQDLRQLIDAEPHDEQRQHREQRDRVQDLRDTVEHILAGAQKTAKHAGHDADGQADREANSRPLQRDRQIGTEYPVPPQFHCRADDVGGCRCVRRLEHSGLSEDLPHDEDQHRGCVDTQRPAQSTAEAAE